MTAKEVSIKVQEYLFERSNIYQAANFSRGYYEADILSITKAMLVTEVEIKISRSDFKADLKKVAKHHRLANPVNDFWNSPNRFYYAVPAGLVTLLEVPKYAGLLYVYDNSVELIKKAPILHKDKVKPETIVKMLQLLTERNIFGSAYLTHKNKQIRLGNDYRLTQQGTQ